MGYVFDLVPVPQADHRPEVVLDNPQMVNVIADVGRHFDTVTPAYDALLAEAWCLPVHFEFELVSLDEAGSLRHAFAELAQEKHESMRAGAVVTQPGVGERLGAASGRAFCQR